MPTTPQTLPADLPQNWTRGQVVAPDGTAVGLTEQHGFNYLCRQVNDAHRVINEQAAVIQELRAELANKINIGSPKVYELELAAGYMVSASGRFQNSITIDAFDRVTIQISAQTMDQKDTIIGLSQIASLPVDFCPSKEIVVPAFAHSVEPRASCPACIRIDTDGLIFVHPYTYQTNVSAVSLVYAEVSFYIMP